AKKVSFDKDIAEMPMGMFTMIPAGGSTLSGGQLQRLIIARAIIRRPSVLIFDEATSALDNLTQLAVRKSLDELNVTRIIIAHRLSTIINADKIYVMKDGEVIESGNYRELMEQNGYFAQLAKRQNV
ncbi:MAG: ATP-binding cassette domain-containing protein, partial [Spirochaetaceae bacterium]|nr:ATP-binding cassette domain-containing protein [Spirochaetaceae bacterium]